MRIARRKGPAEHDHLGFEAMEIRFVHARQGPENGWKHREASISTDVTWLQSHLVQDVMCTAMFALHPEWDLVCSQWNYSQSDCNVLNKWNLEQDLRSTQSLCEGCALFWSACIKLEWDLICSQRDCTASPTAPQGKPELRSKIYTIFHCRLCFILHYRHQTFDEIVCDTSSVAHLNLRWKSLRASAHKYRIV